MNKSTKKYSNLSLSTSVFLSLAESILSYRLG